MLLYYIIFTVSIYVGIAIIEASDIYYLFVKYCLFLFFFCRSIYLKTAYMGKKYQATFPLLWVLLLGRFISFFL